MPIRTQEHVVAALFREEPSADHLPVDRTEILDIVHVPSYSWESAGFFCDSEKQREAFSSQRLPPLGERSNGA